MRLIFDVLIAYTESAASLVEVGSSTRSPQSVPEDSRQKEARLMDSSKLPRQRSVLQEVMRQRRSSVIGRRSCALLGHGPVGSALRRGWALAVQAGSPSMPGELRRGSPSLPVIGAIVFVAASQQTLDQVAAI